MKATEAFKKTIEDHLQKVAEKDPLFAETLKKPGKNITDCVTYILNTVKASGCNGFTDDEIYNKAIHYYDEDNIDVGKPIGGKVMVNHKVELSTDDIEKAKQAALDSVIREEKQKLTAKVSKAKTVQPVPQASLF